MAIVTAADIKAWANIDVLDEELVPVIAAVEAALTVSHALPVPAPADVKQAIVMQVARLWKRRTTIEGVSSFGNDFAMRVNRYDPDIDALLDPYRKWVGA